MTIRKPVDAVNWCDETPNDMLPGRAKAILYGLPCARCKAYYDANLTACPICGCTERVPPIETSPIRRPKSRAA